MYHYLYRLDCIRTGEFYFGSRTSKKHPTLDSYMGSMKSWKPNKNELTKTILQTNFSSREECIAEERRLILENKDHPLNRNYHIPGVGYHTVSLGVYIDGNGNIIRMERNHPLVLNGELKPIW